MTDKQITIDGVDVSGCKFYKGYCRIAALCDYAGHLCEVTPNCYYKQLKRKEQECEELKEQLTILDDEAVVVEIIIKQFEEYKKLKAENEELKQALEEIRKICNSNDELKGSFNLVDCDKYKYGKHNLANKLLNKINEVIDD